jgi:dienelactone hydrolase
MRQTLIDLHVFPLWTMSEIIAERACFLRKTTMRSQMLSGLCLSTLLAWCGAAHAAEAERVQIPTAGLSSSPAPLAGDLYMPAAAPPRGAVVMMHGCGGAYTASGRLQARHRMWADYISGLGYAALIVDSFTPRGVREICTIRFAERTIRQADRVGDAYAAFAFLRERTGLPASAIGILGWSHGGSTVLATMTNKPAAAPAFAGGVALYPGCTTYARRADTLRLSAPALILIGDADDWTPAAACKVLVEKAAGRGERIAIVTYPDTHHSFDNPAAQRLRLRTDVPNGVHPGEGVTVAPNPEAREDALRRVRAFFEAHLK